MCAKLLKKRFGKSCKSRKEHPGHTLLETLVLCGTLLLGVSAGFINFFKEFDMLYPCAYYFALLQNAA